LTFKFAVKSGSLRINIRQRKLLENLKPGELIRLPDYEANYLVSERQGRRDLTALVEAGFLNREGEGPATAFVRLDKPADSAKLGQTRP
jgi:ATP-dependent DNA helicase RecG